MNTPSPESSVKAFDTRFDLMAIAKAVIADNPAYAARRSHGLAPVPELPEPRHLSLVKDDGAVEA